MTDEEVDPGELRRRKLTDRWKDREREEPAEGAEPPAPATAATVPRGAVAGKEKLQAYVGLDLANDARNTWWHTRNEQDGAETFSDFIAASLEAFILQMRESHNGGQPFPERPRKALAPGRPVRK